MTNTIKVSREAGLSYYNPAYDPFCLQFESLFLGLAFSRKSANEKSMAVVMIFDRISWKTEVFQAILHLDR